MKHLAFARDLRDRPVVLFLLTLAAFLLIILLRSGEARAATCNGTSGPDDIICTSGNDYIDSAGGNDQVDALAGDDEVHLGAGNDDAWGRGGLDVIFAGESGTTPWGDAVFGGTGADDIRDLETTDSEGLCGEGGNDIINALDGDGHDFIAGGPDTDSLSGDSGDDINQGSPTCPP